MRLTVVVPAYNEEDAIASTIERCLAARATIVSQSPVDDVEIIVVSDGSTDRTADIAAGYEGIRLVVFDRNRGYGAAIKRGFAEGAGELVGFLDADGTCDPTFFATLCTAVIEENASVAIGSRMGPESRMPMVRRIGNRLYALVLSALSNRIVTDTASGMRVIRRDVLEQLYPLPDGLHFTPAMSARVLMDDALTIVERPMRYAERIGESKLHVIRDGLRFLNIILHLSLMWRPAKMFMTTAVVCLALMTVLALHPIETWLRMGRLEEDMIYRLLFCALLGTFGVTLTSAGVVSDHVHRLLDDRSRPRTFLATVLDGTYSLWGLAIAALLGIPALGWLVGPGLWTRLTDGVVTLHWARVVLAGLIAFGIGQMLITLLITNLVRFHTVRRARPTSERKSRQATAPASMLNPPATIPPPRTPTSETPALARERSAFATEERRSSSRS